MLNSLLIAHCPAKVNLSLRVLGCRSDGYHEIHTILQTIDLWDRIEARWAPQLRLTCEEPWVPDDDSNLVIKAASALQRLYPARCGGASLHLRKGIPAGAGLGGGSSDAAGALLLLSRLWDLSLPSIVLEKVAAALGSDVAFFLQGGTALGTGRGERVDPLPPVGEIPIMVGFPPFGLSTAEVYRRLPSNLTVCADDVTVGAPLIGKLPGRNDFGAAVNDLEAVVFESRPELKDFRDALLHAGAEVALLSGSGSAVFGVFRDFVGAGHAIEALQGRFREWRLLRTRTVESAAWVEEASGAGADSVGGQGGA